MQQQQPFPAAQFFFLLLTKLLKPQCLAIMAFPPLSLSFSAHYSRFPFVLACVWSKSFPLTLLFLLAARQRLLVNFLSNMRLLLPIIITLLSLVVIPALAADGPIDWSETGVSALRDCARPILNGCCGQLPVDRIMGCSAKSVLIQLLK